LLVGACVCVRVVRVVSQREGWRWKA